MLETGLVMVPEMGLDAGLATVVVTGLASVLDMGSEMGLVMVLATGSATGSALVLASVAMLEMVL